MHDLKKKNLVKVVCICLKYQNPNRQSDHSTFSIYHNTLLLGKVQKVNRSWWGVNCMV